MEAHLGSSSLERRATKHWASAMSLGSIKVYAHIMNDNVYLFFSY